jgi:hypothetical protein
MRGAIAFLLLTVFAVAHANDALDDIFNNDAQTRHAATKAEVAWTVNVSGCSGSMVRPDVVLTANHCEPRSGSTYTSGGCLAVGCRGDLRATRVLECDDTLDYCFVEVKAAREDAMDAQRFIPLVLTEESQLKVGRDGEGAALFTVGFPGDKHQAMHAVGFAKKFSSQSLYYNIGVINGNSGGAVWTASDYRLVTLTNFGAHQLGEPGWDDNDPEDERVWNGGPRVDAIYQHSAKMRELFPDGKNPKADATGKLVK